MNGFIRLTDRRGRGMVNINPEHIVAVEDLRTDKVVENLENWQWSIIDTVKGKYEVKETEEEIFKLITALQ